MKRLLHNLNALPDQLIPHTVWLVVLLLLVTNVCVVPEVSAQGDKQPTIPLDHFYVERQGPGIRKLLSKFTFGLSTGYGSTTFKHKLDGYSIYQPAVGGKPLVFDPAQAYINWFNRMDTATSFTPPVPNVDYVVNSDTATIGFKSKSFNIPIRATLHYEFNRYRIGIGYSAEYTKVGDFEPLRYGKDINSFSSPVSSFFLQKYFVMLGASVYRYDNYLLTVDANIGGYGLGKKFDKDGMKRGVFVNVGAMVEREMSEYFKLFVRPSYEFKGYTLTVSESNKNIRHNMNAFYIHVGASYRLPELRKCYHKQCRSQINHAHGNREYRSRIHPIYKKQNPHYGENYPELIKYKGKNKRKLNPY